MFQALSVERDYWKERLNSFIALAPVTRLRNSKSTFFHMISPLGNYARDAMYAIGVYSLFGPITQTFTKYFCEYLESVCFFAEGLVITQNPKYDDPERF